MDAELLEPKWSQESIGITYDVVVQEHCFGYDVSLATLVPSGRHCQISGQLSDVSGPGRFTLFGVTAVSTLSLLWWKSVLALVVLPWVLNLLASSFKLQLSGCLALLTSINPPILAFLCSWRNWAVIYPQPYGRCVVSTLVGWTSRW